MLIGVPKEIKDHEYRVGLTPDSVNDVVLHDHEVIVESGAGAGIGAGDADYAAAGASVADSAEAVFERAEMIVKVKEPQASERAMLREGQILFTYLHLAPDPEQTADLVKSKAVCIAYETVTSPSGGLPLLAPMSEVAGRLSIQAAAHALEKVNGGKGMLLGGVPGVLPARWSSSVAGWWGPTPRTSRWEWAPTPGPSTARPRRSRRCGASSGGRSTPCTPPAPRSSATSSTRTW